MNGYRVISLNYEFDYGRFDKPELQNRAKNTLGELFGFVRSTFDGLIEIGRVLQDFYYDCLAFCPNGKQVFEEWLKSDDFGVLNAVLLVVIGQTKDILPSHFWLCNEMLQNHHFSTIGLSGS